MFKAMAVAIGLTFLPQVAVADDRATIVGIWKLLSSESEFQDGSPRRAVMGQNPAGYIVFTAEGRMMAVLEGEGRKPAQTDQERAALLQTMVAYFYFVTLVFNHLLLSCSKMLYD